jgi:hypothetical protein
LADESESRSLVGFLLFNLMGLPPCPWLSKVPIRGSNFISMPPVAFGRYLAEVFIGPPFLRAGLPLTEVPKIRGLACTYFSDV